MAWYDGGYREPFEYETEDRLLGGYYNSSREKNKELNYGHKKKKKVRETK